MTKGSTRIFGPKQCPPCDVSLLTNTRWRIKTEVMIDLHIVSNGDTPLRRVVLIANSHVFSVSSWTRLLAQRWFVLFDGILSSGNM